MARSRKIVWYVRTLRRIQKITAVPLARLTFHMQNLLHCGQHVRRRQPYASKER